jgi:hypothetical protein
MPEIIRREQWDGSTGDKRRFTRALQPSRVRGVALHYPGDGAVSRAGLSVAQVARILRGFRDYHRRMRGWPDIGYNLLVDQDGRLYEGAGPKIAAHSAVPNTYPQGNHEWIGLQIIIGNNETPSPAARETVAWTRAAIISGDLGKYLPGWGAFPGAHSLSAHRFMPGATTPCPGNPTVALMARGGFNLGSTSRDDDRGPIKVDEGVAAQMRILATAGFYGGLIDGIPGPMFKAAVKAYQAGQVWPDLVADGVWGPVTDRHAHWTLELQRALNKWRDRWDTRLPRLREDYDYGDMTAAMVRAWQVRNHGRAYPRWAALDGEAGWLTVAGLGMRRHP